MFLENTDVRISDPSERDVVRRFPTGASDLEFLQLTASNGSFLLVEVEVAEADDTLDDASASSHPLRSRFHVSFYHARHEKRYRLDGELTREAALQFFCHFLATGKLKMNDEQWIEDNSRRRAPPAQETPPWG